jgi:hypothetical protein
MTADASRRPFRPSVTVRTVFASLAAAVAVAAIATMVVACAPTRDTGAPTPAPTLAITVPADHPSRRS